MEKSQATVSSVDDKVEESGRQKSGIAFPAYDLADSIAVANAVHNKGGGFATREQLAAFLDYKSTNNGAFLSRIGAAKLFGLLIEEQRQIKLSPLATKALMPESDEERQKALIDAFFNAPLFKAIYDEYRGKDLPEGLGLKNALRVKFKVVPKRIDFAYRTFFESADVAGFFETRSGSRSQLIMPVVRPTAKDSNTLKKTDEDVDEKGGGGGGNWNEPPVIKSREDLQNEYIGALIDALREKGKHGEMDMELMERIERLLELKIS